MATQKMHHVPANINGFEIQRPICAVRKIGASLPEFENFTGCSKTDRATFKFLKSMCFIKCEKWSLVCSENGDFQKH